MFFAAQDQSASRAAQCLVRGGSDEMCVADRAGVLSGGDQSGDMGDVSEQQRPDIAGDLAHALEVDHARVGTGAHCDHGRLLFAGNLSKIVVINLLSLLIHAVMDHLIKTT